MDALAKLRYLTLHYRDLQGYRLLPFAGFFLVRAVHDAWGGFYYPLFKSGDFGGDWFLINGLALLACLIFAAFFSNHIGRWYEARYGYVAPPPRTRRDTAFVWGLLVLHALCTFTFRPYGDNSMIIFGLGLVAYHLRRTFPDVRHVPQSVLWIAFGLNFPGVGFGNLNNPAYPSTVFSSAVVIDLVAATMLFLVAIYNHRTLEQLSAARAAVSEEAP